ncbi:MAG: hypothetical protein ABI371_00860 [Gelidibacter sp.]
MVSIDIPEFTKQLKSEVTWQTSNRNAITVFKTNGLRIVLIMLHEKAVMQEHVTNGIISVQVLEGELNFSMDKESKILRISTRIALHSGLFHSVKATKETVFLLTLTTSLKT